MFVQTSHAPKPGVPRPPPPVFGAPHHDSDHRALRSAPSLRKCTAQISHRIGPTHSRPDLRGLHRGLGTLLEDIDWNAQPSSMPMPCHAVPFIARPCNAMACHTVSFFRESDCATGRSKVSLGTWMTVPVPPHRASSPWELFSDSHRIPFQRHGQQTH